MLNDSEYNKLIENVSMIHGYLTAKLQKSRDTFSVTFGDENECRIDCDPSGIELREHNNTIYKFESKGTEAVHGPYYTVIYLYSHKHCVATERVMIKLCRNWQEVKSRINVTLREQQELRDMINSFTL